MRKLAALGLSLVGSLATLAAVRADGLLSTLNPFAANSSATNNQTYSGTSVITSNSTSKTITTVPTMNGIAVHPPAAQPSQPSLLSKMGSGVSNMFTKTKQLFIKSKPAAPTINAPQYKTYPQPMTTSQFIGQPRPQP